MQEEEYLTEADRSIIRRTGGPPLRSLHRVKRQFPFLNVSVVPDLTEVDDTDIGLTGPFLAAFGAAGASQVVMSAGLGQAPPPPQPAQSPILTSSALPGQVSRTRRKEGLHDRSSALSFPGRRGDPPDRHLARRGAGTVFNVTTTSSYFTN